MGKEHQLARLAARLVSGAVLFLIAGCGPGVPPVADAPASVSSTEVIPTGPAAVAPGEPDAGIVPPSASADTPPPEAESPHDMELMKQSVIADWRLSRDRSSDGQAKTVAVQAEPASPPPSPAHEQAPPPPALAQPAPNAGPIPCSMLPATATPCLRQ
jgi:hypothetical protein